MNNRKATLGRMKQREAGTNGGITNLEARCASDVAVNKVVNEINRVRNDKNIPKKQKQSILERAQWDLQRKLGLPVDRLY